MEPTQPTNDVSASPRLAPGSAVARLARLCLKELREVLRDRRTIITLVLMPILVYPLLALVFHRFLLSSYNEPGSIDYVIATKPGGAGGYLARLVAEGQKQLNDEARRRRRDSRHDTSEGNAQPRRQQEKRISWFEADDLEQELRKGSIDLAIVTEDVESTEDARKTSPLKCELLYRSGSPRSVAAVEFFEKRLEALNVHILREQLRSLSVRPTVAAIAQRRAIESQPESVFPLAAVVPLILILMTITGAVYPAIDLTAGERERGTLETLIAAPVPRHSLLLAKYVAVLTVAVLTAVTNLLAMIVTTSATGLAAVMFGDTGMTLRMILSVFGLLVLFAGFFSAILLALTTHARSFKEAQAYLIPLMLLSLGPGILGLSPEMQLSGLVSVTPLLNIVLLARDVFDNNVHVGYACVAVLSTALYALAALSLAARIFGTDAVLYGSQSTWSDLFRRPKQPQSVVSPTTALFCLAILFPCHFLAINLLARIGSGSMQNVLLLCGLTIGILFAGVPWLLGRFQRVDPRSGFGLRGAPAWGFVAAGFLGLALWPIAHEVFFLNEFLGLKPLGIERIASIKSMLARWQEVPLWIILLSLAAAPGIFEELFFRGFLFAALRQIWGPTKTIVTTAILFGLFHVVAESALAVERFLPSTFLGLLLGIVAYRTRSVLPCMLLHTLHNGLLLTIARYREELSQSGVGAQMQRHLPTSWLTVAILVTGTGLLILWFGKPEDQPVADASGAA